MVSFGQQPPITSTSLECKRRIIYSTLVLIATLLLISHHSLVWAVKSQFTINEKQSPIVIDRDDDSKYHIVIKDTLDLSTRDNYDPSRVIPMTIRGELFYCFIPQSRISFVPSTTMNEKEQEEEENHLLNAIVKDLNKKCLYRLSGWWIYELCINVHMRQYHQDIKTGFVSMDYYLGHSPDKEQPVQQFTVHVSNTDPEESHIRLHFDSGTKCDLTNEMRKTEVRIYCASDAKRQQLLHTDTGLERMPNFMGDAEEPSSCSYLVKVYSSNLCKITGFAKKDDNINQIQCVPYDEAKSWINHNMEANIIM